MTHTVVLDAQGSALNQTAFAYDANGNQTNKTTWRTVRSADGSSAPETLVTTYLYDQENRLVQTIHPDGSSTRTIYAVGLDKPGVEIDPLGRETRHFYDQRGNLTNTVFADLTSESFFFDAENRKIGLIDKAGWLMTYSYDGLARMTNAVFADGAGTNAVYDAIGRLVAATDERGSTTAFGYDPNCGCSGRQVFLTNALGQVTHREYDQNGNESSITDTLGRTITYLYDPLDRRTHVVFPDGTFTVTTYDALGRRIAETDQSTNTTWFAYDALSRLVGVTNALGKVTTYAYDEVGNLSAQTDANNHTTTYEYDSMGRRIKRTLPMGMAETYAYDAAGNLTSKVDFNGRATTYSYDALNRLLSKTPDPFFSAPPVTFTYTATGQRATMSAAGGTTVYQYNSRDWLTNKTWGSTGASPVQFSVALDYTYDAHGNLTRIASSNPNGVALAYQWDALDRLTNAVEATHGATAYTYDEVGNLASYLYPNGVSTVHQYDSLNRLTNQTTLSPQLSAPANCAYTLLPTGHRQTAAEALPAIVFDDGKLSSLIFPRPEIIRGHHQCHPAAWPRMQAVGKPGEEFEPPTRLTRVEARQRIVQQQEFRFQHQRPRQRDARAPVPRDAPGRMLAECGKLHQFQNAGHFFFGLCRGRAIMIAQRKSQVLRHGQPVEKAAAILKHQANPQPLLNQCRLVQARQVFAEQEVCAAQRPLQPGGGGQQIAFSCPRQAAHHPVISGRHRPRDVLNRGGFRSKGRSHAHAYHFQWRAMRLFHFHVT